MRSDQTAEFVATRPYSDRNELERALREHNRRVSRAKGGEDDAMAAQPTLTLSGSTVISSSAYECHACYRDVGMAFAADSTTHRIVNRSGEPVRRTVGLCVPCWSSTVRFDGDDHLADTEVRFA
ncbi:hypothetical protein [Streptomyces silvensis]|uniref:Uncharacterized protein n=1 Tax=Streptomyces silvensis TaxID=1765722 RepID=A0A0W7X8D1_9ACTN|nr:hypothetical protein [Streptomyces silvensis]KUF18819.1 hypothetical protein AT728_07225 [Streptomyces silvensis]